MIEVVNVPFTIFILTQRNICVGEGKNHVTLGLPCLVIKFKTVLLMTCFLILLFVLYRLVPNSSGCYLFVIVLL